MKQAGRLQNSWTSRRPDRARLSRPILMVAHGQRGKNRDNALFWSLVHDLKAELAEHWPPIRLEGALLRGKPGFQEAAEIFSPFTAKGIKPLIYPYFMTDGYFVRSVVPDELSKAFGIAFDQTDDCLTPFGLSPHFVPILSDTLRQEVAQRFTDDHPARIHLLAHGTMRNPASARTTYALAEALEARNPTWRVDASFLDQAPFFSKVIPEFGSNHVIVPLFTNPGLHAVDQLNAFAETHPAPHYLEPIAALGWARRLIHADLVAALGGRDAQNSLKNQTPRQRRGAEGCGANTSAG